VAARIPTALIDALTEQPARNKALFDAGDQLKVIDGPFVGFEAEVLRLYEAPDGEARVMVLMDILTRPQKISLPASAVRKAA
jgi:transcriptional antiterminator RfaH